MPRAQNITEVFLMPGEYFVGDAQYRIRTLLGSCVSITLWHPKSRVGAMSHFLLPKRGEQALAEPDGRYGEEALELMLGELAGMGVDGHDCQAKIFGGGIMFPCVTRNSSGNIGRRNVETAQRLLRAHDIPIVSESLLGSTHRQVVFYVKTGEVWVRESDAGAANVPGMKECA